VTQSPTDLRLALTDAGEGKLGSTFDQFVFWCHQFDPNKGGYVIGAYRVMQIAGAVTLLALGTVVWMLLRNEARSKRLAAPGAKNMNSKNIVSGVV